MAAQNALPRGLLGQPASCLTPDKAVVKKQKNPLEKQLFLLCDLFFFLVLSVHASPSSTCLFLFVPTLELATHLYVLRLTGLVLLLSFPTQEDEGEGEDY